MRKFDEYDQELFAKLDNLDVDSSDDNEDNDHDAQQQNHTKKLIIKASFSSPNYIQIDAIVIKFMCFLEK